MIYDALKYFGSAVIALGVIGVVILIVNGQPLFSILGSLIGTFSIGLFFIGFGALLHSIHRIELKVAGERVSLKIAPKAMTTFPSDIKE